MIIQYLICYVFAFFPSILFGSAYPSKQIINNNSKNIIIMMAKGNDNKKSFISNNNQQQPPRVIRSVAGISVKQQIAWIKSYKKLKSQQGQISIGNKFRQNKAPKLEKEEYIEIDYNETKPPAIFVDGYNIIGSMGSFNDENMNLEDARDGLINDLGVLSCLTGWWIEVVFDAYKNKGNIKSKSDGSDGLIVTYTGSSETADNYIERRFSELKAQNFTNMIVATDDMVLRTVAGSTGAGFMPASSLLEEIRIAYMSWENTQLDLENEIKRNQQTVLGNKDTMSDELKEAYILLKMKEAENNLKKEQEREANKEKEIEKQKIIKLEKEKIRRENLKAKLEEKEKSFKKDNKRSPSNHHKPTLADGLSLELLQAIEQMKSTKKK